MTSFVKTTALAAVALLGLAGASTLPTQAAPLDPTLTTLTLQLGLTEEMIARGKQLQDDMVKFGYDADDVDDWCVDRDQIRTALVLAGFNDMDVEDRLTNFRVRVEALYLSDGWVYSMQINRCTGDVTVVAPIYMAADLD